MPVGLLAWLRLQRMGLKPFKRYSRWPCALAVRSSTASHAGCLGCTCKAGAPALLARAAAGAVAGQWWRRGCWRGYPLPLRSMWIRPPPLGPSPPRHARVLQRWPPLAPPGELSPARAASHEPALAQTCRWLLAPAHACTCKAFFPGAEPRSCCRAGAGARRPGRSWRLPTALPSQSKAGAATRRRHTLPGGMPAGPRVGNKGGMGTGGNTPRAWLVHLKPAADESSQYQQHAPHPWGQIVARSKHAAPSALNTLLAAFKAGVGVGRGAQATLSTWACAGTPWWPPRPQWWRCSSSSPGGQTPLRGAW